MKKSYILVFVLLSILSCKKDNKPLFRVVFNPVTIPVTQTMSAFEEHSFLARVKTNFQNTFDANGISPDSINYIRPISATIETIFNGDLDFIRATSIRLCTAGSSNVTRCGTESFWRDPVPNNTNDVINLVNSNVDDVKNLVLKDEVDLQIIFEELWNTPGESFDVRVRVEFGVW